MKGAVVHGAGDVRVETVPDPAIVEPTDAVVSVTHACICGSDLWPYRTMAPSDTARAPRSSPIHGIHTPGRC